MVDLAGDNRTVRLDGERLRQLRRSRALSREQLAEASAGPHRLSIATIKRAENGSAVYLETARRIAALLAVPLDGVLAAPAGTLTIASKPPTAGVAVAVLPFNAIGDEHGTCGVVARGLTEDLATRLGQWWFPVLSPSSSRLYAGSRAPRAAIDLHVAYVVEGSVQADGARMRIRCRLVRTATGEQLWASEYTRPPADVLQLQDELTNAIIDRVHRRLLVLESQRMEQKPPALLDAWELAIRGSQLFYEGTASGNESARACLRRGVSRDPSMASAWYVLSHTYQYDLVNQWTDNPGSTFRNLQDVCIEFERKHPRDGRSDVVAGYLLMNEGKRRQAADRLLRAIDNMPNLGGAYCMYGQVLAMGNEPDKALEQLEICIRLSPCDTHLWSPQLATALAHFVAERYEEAATWAISARSSSRDVPIVLATLASACAHLGDQDRAREASIHLLKTHPHMSRNGFARVIASTVPEVASRYLDGLRRAGLPQ